MNKHTELPWFTRGPSKSQGMNDGGDFAIYIKNDGRDNIIAEAFRQIGKYDFRPAEANAEFIVRACNSHYALLEVCKEALETAHWYQDNGLSGRDYDIDLFEAAIAKAEHE